MRNMVAGVKRASASRPEAKIANALLFYARLAGEKRARPLQTYADRSARSSVWMLVEEPRTEPLLIEEEGKRVPPGPLADEPRP